MALRRFGWYGRRTRLPGFYDKIFGTPCGHAWTLSRNNQRPNTYGNCFLSASWTNYSVEARLRFPSNAYGGGLGARLDSGGGHYAAWIYPDNSQDGANRVALIKFSAWGSWSSLLQTNVSSVGTNWHTLKLAVSNSNALLQVYYDGNMLLNATDTNSPYSSGGASIDMWTHPTGGPYDLNLDDLVIIPQ